MLTVGGVEAGDGAGAVGCVGTMAEWKCVCGGGGRRGVGGAHVKRMLLSGLIIRWFDTVEDVESMHVPDLWVVLIHRGWC